MRLVGTVAVAFICGTVCAAPVDEVNVFIGTDGTGHTTPAAWYPSGLVQPGPDSGYADWAHCSGYRVTDATLCGFAQTHLSGTGVPDLSDFLLQPFVGANPMPTESASPHEPTLVMRTPKRPRSEQASPAYYSVAYDDSGIRTEIAAAERVGIYRFTADKGGFKLLVDAQWNNSRGDIRHAVVDSETAVGEDRCSIYGHVRKKAFLSREVWFKAVFDRPFRTATKLPRAATDRADRWVLDFALAEGEQLLVKTSISASSAEGVERNLAEVPDWDFDRVRTEGRRAWNDLLSRVVVNEPVPDRRTVFYTALYHAYIQPTRLSDAGEADYYSSFSLWDTFRAVHPLYSILRPEMSAPFVTSLLTGYRRSGKLPVIPYFGFDTDCMIGKHAVPLIVDAYLKGVEGPDWDLAYEAVTNALTVTHAGAQKEDWDVYNRLGYYPFDIVGGEGVSRTLEIAFDDWCAAEFAARRGDAAGERFFRARAGNWTNVLDRTMGLVRGRDSQGRWRTPFDPSRFGGAKDWLPYDCTEGNAWQYTWHVFQDPKALIAALGGERAFAAKLRSVFSREHVKSGDEPDDCTGRMGEYVHGNEPSHHILYFFPQLHDGNFAAGKIREICEKFYFNAPDGLCGNDDCGQMSAWYVFACLGFYPFNPCGGEFVLGAPQLPGATLRLPNGKEFRIVTENFSKENRYVRRMWLNGQSRTEPKLAYDEVMRGGELRFEMWNPLKTVRPAADIPVSLVPDHLRNLLDKPRQVRERLFEDETARLSLVAAGAGPKPVTLVWQWRGRANPTFTVDVFRLPEDRCVLSAKTSEQRLEVNNLKLDSTYRWTVRCETFGGEVEAEGRFSVSADGPRILSLPQVYNLRDLGGWKGLSGRRVKQGLIYRSAGFNDNSTDGGADRTAWRPASPRFGAGTAAEIRRVTGVRTDLDLRNEWETYGMAGSPLGDGVAWVQASSRAYGEMDRPDAKAAFAKVFRTVSDARNLPLVFHCITGADRTGTVSYLLNALLGVAEADLVADWEATVLYNTSEGFTHRKIAALSQLLDRYPGVCLADRAAAYVKSCGFSDADIDAFRNLMLGEIGPDSNQTKPPSAMRTANERNAIHSTERICHGAPSKARQN